MDMNFVRKHALEMQDNGLENSTARLFSNPAGDYGSMVRVTTLFDRTYGIILSLPLLNERTLFD